MSDVKRKRGGRVVVYRVEQKGGVIRWGPYFHGGYEHWHEPNRPEPKDDRLAADSWKGMVFGFASRRQLNAWFNRAELRRLRRHGFAVRTYKVHASDIICGRFQVAFRRPYRVVKKLPDDDLADVHDRYADKE
jgi:hypothetical protein